MTFIARPSRLFEQYWRELGNSFTSEYHIGRMAVALEIITQIKCLEEFKALTTEVGRAEAVAALDTLLIDCGLKDEAYKMYERLDKWRKPKFEPTHPILRRPDEQPSLEHARSVAAAVAASRALRSQQPNPEIASEPSSPEESRAQTGKPQSSLEEHRGQDEGSSPSPETGEPPASAAE